MGFYLRKVEPRRIRNFFGIAPGRLTLAVGLEALGLESVEAGPPLSALIALWSVVAAILGIAIWLFKTGQRLLVKPKPMRLWVRWLNVGAALGLTGIVAAVLVFFPQVVGTSIGSAKVYFPDLMLILFTSCGLAIVLALGRLALVVRGG